MVLVARALVILGLGLVLGLAVVVLGLVAQALFVVLGLAVALGLDLVAPLVARALVFLGLALGLDSGLFHRFHAVQKAFATPINYKIEIHIRRMTRTDGTIFIENII